MSWRMLVAVGRPVLVPAVTAVVGVMVDHGLFGDAVGRALVGLVAALFGS